MAGKTPSDIKLRNTVLNRYKDLESLRKAYKSKQGDYKSKLDQLQELSLQSTQSLREAFERHGWPGPDVVGPDCAEALAYVSANATYDADFQNESTRLMGEALPEGGICAHWYARLRDRYLVLSNRPTIYGSSFDAYLDDDGAFKLMEYEVVDPDNLNKRRAQVGFESVEDERLRFAKQAVEENWPLRTYEQCVKSFESISIEGGYQSQ